MRIYSYHTAYSLIWGAVLMVTAACHNAAGLLVTRFFLGVAESAIAPGLTIIIAMFYKRKEQPLRHAAWFLGNTTAGALGGLLNFGIGHIRIIEPWKVCASLCWLDKCFLTNLSFREPSSSWVELLSFGELSTSFFFLTRQTQPGF